ncbi:MAG: GH39 family glycosyl hydrolase [Prosthecobacter sp.]|uniref:GH39 family glycosyl hydrolase n=1 Tax=Prosthecobacter sp. TaxID=1965333 RepID=UPI0038FDB73C
MPVLRTITRLFVLFIALTLSVAHGQELDLNKFKLTFSDEFDGDKLDTTKWQAPEMPRQGSCRWVRSLATVSDGALHLGIRLSDDPVLRYDCAAVRTRKDYDPKQTMFAQRYGYYEARAKLPKNMKSDYWAAFWMMCGNVNSPDTRGGIEADILESFQHSNEPRYSMNFHWNGYGKQHNSTGVKLAPTPELMDGGFHRFGMYWDENYYVAYFDGREVGRTDLIGLGGKDNGKTQSRGPCQKPGYLKLSCEAAAWVGATNQWEKEPTKEDEFVIDYVRVYEGTLPAPAPRAVHIQFDAAAPTGPLKPIWRFFGADEPNYAYMKHGSELLGELGELKKDEVFFRTHSLLTTGKGEHGLKWGSTNAYTEDAAGKPIYDWTIVDRIFDTYRDKGVRPYVQIGFMPQALSVKPEPYRHHFPDAKYEELFGGWAYPPKDYAKWEELVFQWAKHCAERYGNDEVLHWYWQTWNEPNIDYWKGTRDEFFKLHDHAIRAVRRAIPKAKVGGPDLAQGNGGDYLAAFLNHCDTGTNLATGEKGTPLDFISFHAKGSPKQVDGHVQMGLSNQLRDIDGAFATIARRPQMKNTPIIIGESDPEGCAACKGADRAYRNGTMYSSYTAASFPRKLDLAEKHGVNLEGALTWAFEFEDQPYFAGFRSLATNGIDKPVLNVFRMFSRMSGDRLLVQSDAAVPLDDLLKTGVRDQADVSALAARDGKRITILAWHYHDDDVRGLDADLTLTLTSTPEGNPKLTRTLIDDGHSNSFMAWQALGSPELPTREQIRLMELASQLAPASDKTEVKSEKGNTEITFKLARQGVTLLELDWP